MRRHADLKQALVPIEAAKASPRLTMPFEPEVWLADRKARLKEGMERLARAARAGEIPGGSIENGVLKVDRLTAATPADAEDMVLDPSPRQHELALALREIGRIERTLFIIEWSLDAEMQRRAPVGLNKAEAHHALKSALRIGRQGEIRDRTAEGQRYRMAGLNLLAAIMIS